MKKETHYTNLTNEIEVGETSNESKWVWATATFAVLFLGFLIVRSLV